VALIRFGLPAALDPDRDQRDGRPAFWL
jgi:hypothetical protein